MNRKNSNHKYNKSKVCNIKGKSTVTDSRSIVDQLDGVDLDLDTANIERNIRWTTVLDLYPISNFGCISLQDLEDPQNMIKIKE